MAYRKLNLRYDARCGVCRKLTPAGKEAYYDPDTSRVSCKSCYSKIKSDPAKAFASAQESTLQSLIDEYAKNPSPAALADMARRHDVDEPAAKFLRERGKFAFDRNYVLIQVKWTKRCHSCERMLLKHSWAIWHAHTHHVWCLTCTVDGHGLDESIPTAPTTPTPSSPNPS